jgi:hypothetical protein
MFAMTSLREKKTLLITGGLLFGIIAGGFIGISMDYMAEGVGIGTISGILAGLLFLRLLKIKKNRSDKNRL